MVHRRLTALALPLLLLSGCAGMGRSRPVELPAGERFAMRMEQADEGAAAAILRMAEFERVVRREKAAVAYAIGARMTAAPSEPLGAAEAAGQVFAPAFTALADYGHVLTHVSARRPIQGAVLPGGADLARATEAGLAAVQGSARVTVTPAVRSAGLAGVQALADLAGSIARRGGGLPDLRAVTAEAEPHLAAVVALLQEVLGSNQDQAVRGAIRASRQTLTVAHGRLLAAGSHLGPVARYELFRDLAALRDTDPAPGTLRALYEVLERMRLAHAALAADPSGADADAKVSAFEAAVAHLGSFTEADEAH